MHWRAGGGRGGSGEEEISSFPQIFYSLDLSLFFLTFFLAFCSCLFPLLPLLSSPLSTSLSLSDFHCLSTAFEFYYGHLQSFLRWSSAWCSFPPLTSCHTPVIFCNSENEKENTGATSLSEPWSLYWLHSGWPAPKPACLVSDWL